MLIPVPDDHSRLADRVVVLQDGRFVEQGPTYEILTSPEQRPAAAIFATPTHPYTQHPLASTSVPARRALELVSGGRP
jgi:ABC-type dipeptide/oligopeptide/nickel transport system ATPase component